MALLRHFMKVFSLSLAVSLAIVACGDDSTSAEDSKDVSKSSSSSKSESSSSDLEEVTIKDSSAIGDIYHSEKGDVTVIKGEVADSAQETTYKTFQIGAYVWMAENATFETVGGSSLCYNKDDSKCSTYGRLYEDDFADNACPEGFVLPHQADFEYLHSIAGNLYETGIGFNLKMGGYCLDDYGDLKCEGLKKEAYFMLQDDQMLHLDRYDKMYYGSGEDNAFYSVRCLKFVYFVETKDLLPNCNSKTSKYLKTFFVASENRNYECSGSYWTSTSKKTCPSSEQGKRYYHNDSLYICDDEWRLATIDDMDEKCTAENNMDERLFNDVHYVCEDSSWREATEMEELIGVCKPSNNGSIDSLKMNGKKTYVYCDFNDSFDSTGWRKATVADYHGKCDSTRLWEKVTFYESTYACRIDDQWSALTTVESEIGLCTDKDVGKIDSVDSWKRLYYVCKAYIWKNATIDDFFGKCDSTNFYKEVVYDSTKMTCRTWGVWKNLDSLEQSIGVCSPAISGKIDSVKTTGYVCDSITVKWRIAKLEDYYEKCDKNNHYKVVEFQGKKYGCLTNTWTVEYEPISSIGYCTADKQDTVVAHPRTAKLYKCVDGKWSSDKDDFLGKCTEDLTGTVKKHEGVEYVCDNETWRTATADEKKKGAFCTSKNEDDVAADSSKEYICKSGSWLERTIVDDYGSCTSAKEGEAVQYASIFYVCDGTRWKTASDIEAAFGGCTDAIEDSVVQVKNGDVYKCRYERWERVSRSSLLGNCYRSKTGLIEAVADSQYFCTGFAWRPYTDVEKTLGLCDETLRGETGVVNSVEYGCVYRNSNSQKEYVWRKFVKQDSLFGFCSGTEKVYSVNYEGLDYSCGRYGESEWNQDERFWSMFGTCSNSDEYGAIVTFKGREYFCEDDVAPTSDDYYGWYPLGTLDSIDGPCYKARVGDTIEYDDTTFDCGKNASGYYRWVARKPEE